MSDGGVIDLTGHAAGRTHRSLRREQGQEVRRLRARQTQTASLSTLFVESQNSLLVLTGTIKTARALSWHFSTGAFRFGKGTCAIGLEKLVNAITAADGDSGKLGSAIVDIHGRYRQGIQSVRFWRCVQQEISEGCAKPRKGKPAAIQELARCVLKNPNHRGVAAMLRHLEERKAARTRPSRRSNSTITANSRRRSGWEDFADAETGLAEITHHRTYARPKPPAKAISTIHKAKGLECDSVVVMPCDAKTFPDKKDDTRCLLYVALSRATETPDARAVQRQPEPFVQDLKP